jgi:5-hydroxyisourate hydrolase
VTISTHVLDTAAGRPASGVAVSLQRRDGDAWIAISAAVTNDDGRVPELVPAAASLVAGTYRLSFEVGPYFARRAADSFYGTIAVDFVVREPDRHHHVPLLVSPFGYSTYRGS